MDNQLKIGKISAILYGVFTLFIIVIPILHTIFWITVNHLPDALITVNSNPASLSPNKLTPGLQIIGFIVGAFPLAVLMYGLANVRKLFFLYKTGEIFSFEHVKIFKKIAKALIFWVILSILYESAKSVIFSMGNPPGSRMLSVGIGGSEITTIVVAGISFAIAWVMDEARILSEENELTV